MARQRIRIRFCKDGDLRLIGHRDLLRAFERLLRRCGLALKMSEGYHPKPRISFPSALSLGVRGLDEVMEFELTEPVAAHELKASLSRHAPPGLSIGDVQVRPAEAGKARVHHTVYELPLPEQRRVAAAAAVESWLARSTWPVQRDGSHRTLDVRQAVDRLELSGDVLRMRLSVSGDAQVRPAEVLAALGLDDLLQMGFPLTRTAVEVRS
jgi:radical SAM-linked protein